MPSAAGGVETLVSNSGPLLNTGRSGLPQALLLRPYPARSDLIDIREIAGRRRRLLRVASARSLCTVPSPFCASDRAGTPTRCYQDAGGAAR